MNRLEPHDHPTVRPLFAQLLDWNLIINATLEGICPGEVVVDDVTHPQTAYMTSAEGDFWVGNLDNAAFNAALHDWLFSRDAEIVFLEIDPAAWETKIAALFHPRQPILQHRLHYAFRQACIDWRASLPEGYAIARVDSDLLNRPGLEIPDHVTDWAEGNFGSIEAFLQHGFGFCALHDNRVVCWCMADCVSGNACEIGIHTLPEFRRRGLATCTVAATVEYCLSRGLTAIGWHCNQDNTGSRGVAEKVGFEQDRESCAQYCYVDEITHQAELGYVAFVAGQHQQTAALYEQVFARRPDSPGFWYHLAARACAVLGEKGRALDYLNRAVDRGWSAVDQSRACVEFESLHGTPEWDAVLERMQH